MKYIDYFNPSPNIDDRRDGGRDPIGDFIRSSAPYNPEAANFDSASYLRDNPTTTPNAESELAQQAGALDLMFLQQQKNEEKMARYRALLAGKDPDEELKTMNNPLSKVAPK